MEALEKMLQLKIIFWLLESNLLPNDFNAETNNLLDITPFSSADFKDELVIAFTYIWKQLSPEFTDA